MSIIFRYSKDVSNANKETQITSTLAQPAVKITPAIAFGGVSSNLLLQPALQRNYLKLLANTYAPETVDAWKQALDERKQLKNEMPKPQFIIKAELPESFKRQQKLAEAVEADDAATIRSLLPELLKDYKNKTEALRKAVKTLKDDTAKLEEGKEAIA